MSGRKYILSLTFNIPGDAFEDEDLFLFQGAFVDYLWLPMHMNLSFFSMSALRTFVCYDVMKNPKIKQDFER